MNDDVEEVDDQEEIREDDSDEDARAALSDSGRRAIEILEDGLREWTTLDVDGGTLVIATKRSNIEDARRALEEAEALGSQDAVVAEELRGYGERIAHQEERVFHGSVLAGLLAIGLGLLFIFSGAGVRLAGFAYTVFAVLYFPAVQPRRYVLNRRRLSDSTFTSAEIADDEGGGFINRLFIAFFTAMFIHLITVWAFLRNYVFSD
jgi:hypothetical protein